MVSPIRAVIAAALLLGFGGALLVAQPFEQGEGNVPAVATTELAEPVAFTGSISPSGGGDEETCEDVDGISQCRGLSFKFFIIGISDPRLDGKMTASQNRDTYADGRWFVSWTYRIANDDGAWQGSADTLWHAGDFGSHSVVFTGTGAYEGLYAWMDMSDWSEVTGVIFPAPPPEIPAPLLDESGA